MVMLRLFTIICRPLKVHREVSTEVFLCLNLDPEIMVKWKSMNKITRTVKSLLPSAFSTLGFFFTPEDARGGLPVLELTWWRRAACHRYNQGPASDRERYPAPDTFPLLYRHLLNYPPATASLCPPLFFAARNYRHKVQDLDCFAPCLSYGFLDDRSGTLKMGNFGVKKVSAPFLYSVPWERR